MDLFATGCLLLSWIIDDMNPRVLKTSGFKHLDRVIELCAKHGIYTILDMHTAPGGQNTDWHSDHGGHIANCTFSLTLCPDAH
jgi:aryl-phospho-beta-D-glucosidase BglC (GH1 family)